MAQEILLIPAFEKFIKETLSGKRTKPSGERIKPQSALNYFCVINHLRKFEVNSERIIRIKPIRKPNKRLLAAEKNYWALFYRQFSEYLYRNNCFDNYVGSIFKIVRTFFQYLNRDKLVTTGEFYKSFYVRKEEISILTLNPKQLSFLISDANFDNSLRPHLKRVKDIFVFGCTVGLRFSDLFNICVRDIEYVNDSYYLSKKTLKTNARIKVKLPRYAVDVVTRYSKRKKPSSKIFLEISLNQFNQDLKKILEKAGWTYCIGKSRKKNGREREVLRKDLREYRFCDLASSHLMRRTAVTTMLMLGMPEHAVKKISGHTANSNDFHRYVSHTQSYLDQEIDKVHAKLTAQV